MESGGEKRRLEEKEELRIFGVISKGRDEKRRERCAGHRRKVTNTRR